MKQLFFTLLILPALFSSKASTIEIGWGSDQKFNFSSEIKKILRSDKDGYYVLEIKGKDYFIERYSNTHQLEGSKEVLLKDVQKRECVLEEVISTSGKFVLFMSRYDKPSKSRVLYMQTFDQTLSGTTPEEVSSYEVNDFKNDLGKFIVCSSDDHTKVIVGNKKYNSGNVNYKLFDGSLRLISEESFETHPKYYIHQNEVDNEGRLILFDKYDILIHDPAIDKLAQAHLASTDKVSIEETTGKEILFVQNQEDGKIYVGGYYHNKKEPFSNGGLNVEGVIYARIDKKTGTIEAESVTPFAKEFLAQFDQRYTKSGGINGLFLKSILPNKNGSLSILGEQSYSDFSSSGKIAHYHMYIVAMNMSKTGEVNWSIRIPKVQISDFKMEVHASFLAINLDNELILLYYDNAKNFSENSGSVSPAYMKGTSDVVLIKATITNEGEVNREIALPHNKKEPHYLLDPSLYYKFESGNFLVHATDFSSSVAKFGTVNIK